MKKKILYLLLSQISGIRKKLLAGYPAAGYPAKSVSGTTLVKHDRVVLVPWKK